MQTQTSIGVFASRADAEKAVQELVDLQVPKESITLLTPEYSEDEVKRGGKTMGAYVGGSLGAGAGLSLGMAAAALAIPGVGTIFAIGVGAAALLGLGGAAAGGAAGEAFEGAIDQDAGRESPEAGYFRTMLKERHSVVVVRTEDHDLAQKASQVLHRLGLGTDIPSAPGQSAA